MKKLICFVLCTVLCLTMVACGQKEAKDSGVTPDMQTVYEDMKPYLPEDASLYNAEFVFNAYGVKSEDCKQQVVLSYYDGAVTAELWLIEAVSKDALTSIKKLAETRLDSMTEQFKNYDPKAAALCEDAELFTHGNCLVLMVSDNAQQLLEIYNASR